MKKNRIVAILAVVVLAVIATIFAFSMKSSDTLHQQTSASSKQQAVSSTSTSRATQSTTINQPTTASSATSAPSVDPFAGLQTTQMDLEAISQGDFSSIIGTWKNSHGQTLNFNTFGLVHEGLALAQYGSYEGGMYMVSVNPTNGGGTGAFALSMVPAGTTISDVYLQDTSDVSDTSRDRMFATQALVPAEALKNDTYYRVTENAKIHLDSGDSTVDYANKILGNRNWQVIESNYNRTEAIPFELIQGENQSLYRIYQNGVIISENTNQIIYRP